MITVSPPSAAGDDTPLVQSYLNQLRYNEEIFFSYGRYKIYSPLLCPAEVIHLRGKESFLDWYGKAGTMLQIGFPSKSPVAGGLAGSGCSIEGLTLHHTGIGEPLMQNQSTALCVQNCYAGNFDININGFGTGLSIVGDGTGCTYNNFYISQLLNNQTSVKARVANGGFVTRSWFHGGRWQYGPIAKDVPVTHMDIDGPGVGSLQFLGCSYEGFPTTTIAAVDNTDLNLWFVCTYESSTGAPMPFIFGPKATRCRLRGSLGANVDWQDGNLHAPPTMANVFSPDW